MNTVVLTGRVATDVELRVVGKDKHVASFLLAVDRPGDGRADVVRVSTWDRQAHACTATLAKGHRVGVGGRLRRRSWEDADGNRRSAVEVVASTVELLGARAG